jgi:hypothetical protein
MNLARVVTPGGRAVLLVGTLLATVTTVPYYLAWRHPPPGQRFLGFFFQIEDVYNYLGYVQQAEDGALVFANKAGGAGQRPALVNLEWLLVGRLSLLLGRQPALAYRGVGVAAVFALLAAALALLRRTGVPLTHATAALLLVGFGAGLGGLRYVWLGPPAWRSLDLISGLFPFVAALVNPHFVVGAALLCWSLLSFLDGRTGRAVLLGSVLGLVRPYDLAMLVAVRVLGVCSSDPPRIWPRRLAPLVAFVPVLAYNLWVFYVSPGFRIFSDVGYRPPPLVDMAVALGPAAVLAAFGLSRGHGDPAVRAHVLAWAGLGLALAVVRPFAITLQFLVCIGVPLFVLGARGLGRLAPAATALVAISLSSTAVVALSIVLRPNPRWFVPQERFDAGLALRGVCQPGHRLLAPADIGLYAAALSSCHPLVAHPGAPDYESLAARLDRFYGPASASERRRLLADEGIDHVVVPGAADPEAWLGPGSGFSPASRVRGPHGALSIYSRLPGTDSR